jgi:pimeloyl-ACP methyl ester carboxylesterase
VAAWERAGRYRKLTGRRIFTVDMAATGPEERTPLLVVHGFPTCSFDFHLVLPELARTRRVLLLDMLGYGLSAKPDIAYSVDLQADIVAAFTEELGLTSVVLLTHDLGDTVGGELLARNLEGRWPVTVERRVLTNGSIYIEMAHLSAGQELLLSLPNHWLPADAPLDAASVSAGLAGTFSPASRVPDTELAAAWELVSHLDGHRALARLIRYIEERRANQDRYTGPIERHPSPLSIIWGADDPIALVAMTDRLQEARPDSSLSILDGVGHYPMLEAPDRFSAAVSAALG